MWATWHSESPTSGPTTRLRLAFELHKFPEIGDMKPSEMMRQMKALLPPDSTSGTYFMAAFLLCLPADMIDHIIPQDFKDCTKMAEYANKLYARRRGNAVAAFSDSPINAVSGGRRRESSPHERCAARRPARGAATGRPPGRTKKTATSASTTPPTANRR